MAEEGSPAKAPRIPADKAVHLQRFNDDLLADPRDQALAEDLYGTIYHVLDFPALREKFAYFDQLANRDRRAVRSLGLLAILLSAIALIASALRPMLSHPPEWIDSMGVVTEALGIVGGVVLAIGGVVIYRRKSTWLRARLMAERLRQFHFQVIVHRWPEVVASCSGGDEARGRYRAQRDRWFREFLNQYEGHLASRLTAAIGTPGAEGCWLVGKSTETPQGAPPAELAKAYRELRIEQQHLYAQFKLRTDTNVSVIGFANWPIPLQEFVLRFLSSVLILIALFASLLSIYGHSFDFAPFKHVAFSGVTVVAFIIGAWIRAVEESLVIGPEQERYNDYGARVLEIRRRFDSARDETARLELMEEMEREVFDELRGFLRANKKARFVL